MAKTGQNTAFLGRIAGRTQYLDEFSTFQGKQDALLPSAGRTNFNADRSNYLEEFLDMRQF